MVSIEEQAEWLTTLLVHMRDRGLREIEALALAEANWTAHVQERAAETLYMTADSFYNGGEMPGKPRVFMPYSGGVRNYRRLLNTCASEGYAGFDFRPVAKISKTGARRDS
jgi:cyclohexanone monooxygenase